MCSKRRGSGTAALAALKSGRKYVGYDINKEYIDLAEKRISQFLNNQNSLFIS
ncbi:MAG: hypothetical protein EVJ47_05315 [Candidatus Acidulodesulfobacterium ferriphilum]|uniref:DNA methylase N-4/N-6 domain-containing protein n=1 Tax=Candidatus Acidulodesulfobacterium ferriphilum TaxID=2597223 RepID=A0A519BBV2_9DELT|nr:MAG: hypothetical protein EVJ47_05315 [Candidatus Acidulodesulfobacterium ferriphilum]